MPRLIATFRPQQWVNDYAVNLENETEFDATEAFLQQSLEEIHRYKENDYASDHLSIGQPCREEHDGPFEVDADVNEWLEQNGVPDHKTMTEADLQLLRAALDIVII